MKYSGIPLFISIALLLTACGGGGGSNNPDSPSQPGTIDTIDPVTPDPGTANIPRIANLDCLAPDYPSIVATDLQLEAAFPNLPAIPELVGLHQPPNDSAYWYALRQDGYIYQFENTRSASSYSVFLDISASTYSPPGEAGLLGLAFHPNFSSNGQVFIYYMPTRIQARISRFTINNTGTALERNTEKIILNIAQPDTNHNGGGLAFGPDGYLYLGLGDGGGAEDTFNNGQNTNTLLGSLLRLDIDVSDDAIAYKIPSDNPFANGQGGLPEIYAYGLRNPWRWSFDRTNGDIWVGDVGQYEVEEIDIIQAGANYGWPIMEGSQCFNSNQCDQSGLELPVLDYLHSTTGGCAVTGGYVYRGQQLPALKGSYLFGDYCSGVIYTLTPDSNGYSSQRVIDSSLSLSSFAEDNDGEIYALNLFGNAGEGIYKIVAGNNAVNVDLIPDKLSDSGCYSDTANQTVAEGVIAYEVNSRLWSDGAEKKRYFALPDNSRFILASDGDFISPTNSILIKSFYYNDEIIETRLLMKHITGWAGYSYEWNAGKTEAYLLSTGKQVLIDSNYIHIFPSRGQCLDCHIAAAGMTLGIETLQLNHQVALPTGGSANYLERLFLQGYLVEAVPAALMQEKLFSLDDNSATLEQKARSYLHSNCAGCHRPGGPIPGMDLRYNTKLIAAGICNQAPVYGDLGQSGAQLLSPGNASQSVISLRIRDTANFRMPPLGTNIVDNNAAEAIDDWINSLIDCN